MSVLGHVPYFESGIFPFSACYITMVLFSRPWHIQVNHVVFHCNYIKHVNVSPPNKSIIMHIICYYISSPDAFIIINYITFSEHFGNQHEKLRWCCRNWDLRCFCGCFAMIQRVSISYSVDRLWWCLHWDLVNKWKPLQGRWYATLCLTLTPKFRPGF